MRIELPHLAANLPQAKVSEWHVGPGTQVQYGTALCDVAVSDRVKLSSGSPRANVLLRRSRRRPDHKSNAELESDRFRVLYRVVASETATITELRAHVGDVVEAGELLAIASTNGDVEEAPGAQMPALRVVASIVSES